MVNLIFFPPVILPKCYRMDPYKIYKKEYRALEQSFSERVRRRAL